jgi:hypothetical protein
MAATEDQRSERGSMAPAISNAVVRCTREYTVIAFFSDNHIDADMAIESFVLAPQAVSEDRDQPST